MSARVPLSITTHWPILAAVTALAGLGVVSIWFDVPPGATEHPEAVRQMVFVGVGLLALGATQLVPYRVIGRWAWPFYAFSLALVAYTVVAARVGGLPCCHEIKGAYNWLSFPGISMQPSELVKVAFVLVMARYLRYRQNYRTLAGLLPPFLLAGVPMLLILKQPDLGTALVFIPALMVLLFVAGARKAHLLAVVSAGLVLAPVIWFAGPKDADGPGLPVLRHLPVLIKSYQRARVQAMFSDDPATLQKTGFQQHQALMAFGSGGLTGRGAGQLVIGRRVPEAHNDMIFALIGEQFGFLGAAVVLGAYLIIVVSGVEIAASTREPFGRLIAVGIVAMIIGQAFLNLTVALKLMPVTGVTLPFVSYGGSSLLASFLSAGILLNVGQHKPLVMARSSFEFA